MCLDIRVIEKIITKSKLSSVTLSEESSEIKLFLNKDKIKTTVSNFNLTSGFYQLLCNYMGVFSIIVGCLFSFLISMTLKEMN